MRRAVAYVRKSTPQEGDALRSVARQEEGARAYCREHGLDLVRVYADEAISGLRVPKARPAFARMMQDAEAGGFEVVLCYDLDRLGRNARRMAESLYRLLDLGVKVIDFTQGTAVDLTSSAGRLTLSFRLELAQGEAERARQRARDAHEARAKRGWVCGPAPFGYRNERVADHVERRVHEPEARVVRSIFQQFAAGESLRNIVKKLNAGPVRMPARNGRVATWSPTTIRQILKNDLYRGVATWGARRTLYDVDQQLRAKRTLPDGRELPWSQTADGRERDHVQVPSMGKVERVEAPGLRVVDDATCKLVDEHFRAIREGRHDPGGRRPKDPGKAALLSGGLLICAECQGHFEARRGYYVCSTRRRKHACTNFYSLPVEETDARVIEYIEDEALAEAQKMLASFKTTADERAQLEGEVGRLRAEIKRLMASLAAGISAATVVPEVKARETEITKLEARLRAPRPAAPDIKKVEKALREKTSDWRTTLRGHPQLARVLLRKLVGPMRLHAVDEHGQVKATAENLLWEALGQQETSPRR